MKEIELIINKIAQQIIPLEDGLDWFDSSTEEQQKEIMRTLDLCLHQSHPLHKEIEEGIKISGLKETYTPCVLMLKKSFNEARNKILKLPISEWRKSFILWVAIFSIADLRRRETNCKNGCEHEWHNLNRL